MDEIVKCEEYRDDRSILNAKENGKKYELINREKVLIAKIKIDKCIKSIDDEKKCDFLFCKIDEHGAYFDKCYLVELKGGDLVNGIKQINNTINFINKKLSFDTLNARIVGSRNVPNIKSTPDYRNLKNKIINLKGTLEIATNKYYKENL